MKLFRAWYPEAYQGTLRKKGYFEGWYLKLIDSPGKTIFALIPGVSTGRSRNDAHAFIQLINAVTGKTEYFRFALEAFSADDRKFDVRIGSNHFWDGGMQVNLQNETTSLSGSLRFEQVEKYPTSLLHPGIMGPFSFIPWMECYHGVVNISHTIVGSLMYNGGALDMTGGEGYIEKDWGKSFPKSWIWMQANHFSTPKASFMFSLARIPWLGTTFTGLICFLRTDQGFFRFATYNGAKVRELVTEGNQIKATLKNPTHTLAFTATYTSGGILKAPKNGMMLRDIEESITAQVTVDLLDAQGNVLFHDASNRVGMEIAGDPARLMTR